MMRALDVRIDVSLISGISATINFHVSLLYMYEVVSMLYTYFVYSCCC